MRGEGSVVVYAVLLSLSMHAGGGLAIWYWPAKSVGRPELIVPAELIATEELTVMGATAASDAPISNVVDDTANSTVEPKSAAALERQYDLDPPSAPHVELGMLRPQRKPAREKAHAVQEADGPELSAYSAEEAETAAVPPVGSRGAHNIDAEPLPGNPRPAYPSSARRRGIEGRVLLIVQLTAQGLVENVRLTGSSENDALDKAAVEAVRNWRFRAATRDGQPIASSIQIPIRFRLD